MKFLQKLGKAILLPVAWLIGRLTGSVYLVWWCFPIAEILSLAASAFFLRAAPRHMRRSLHPGTTA